MRISDWSSDVCSADLSDGLATLNRLAIAIYRPGRQFALAVGERLVKLHREGVGEIVEDIFARSDVDLHVAPILGRDLGQAALHQRLAGGDDLDDGGVARSEEHPSELQSIISTSDAVFCLKKKQINKK